MKKPLNIRLIFVFVCIFFIVYIFFKRDISVFNHQSEYKKYDLVINEVMINNRNSIRDNEGDFEGWVEIYNKGDKAVNLKNFGLSNDSKQPFLWKFPDKIIEPKSFCLVWTSSKNISKSNSPLHTNFKLNNNDKVIILTSPTDIWRDIFLLKAMETNISYGRKPDGSSSFYGFDEGTPRKPNIIKSLVNGPNGTRLSTPTFSHDSGFFTESFNLILKNNSSDSNIYYTVDGSTPTTNSNIYTKPILIPLNNKSPTIIRARVYKDRYPTSKIITHSYFVSSDIYNKYNTPVISLVTDPENLFDYEKGIYITGKVFDQWKLSNPEKEINSATPANYNQRGKNWERQGTIELINEKGKLDLVQDIGIRIYGGYSRSQSLKSLSLSADKDYDNTDYFYYDFFNEKSKNQIYDKSIDRFSRILLRTSATDSKYSLFRDVLIQSLIKTSQSLDTQSYKPCILYINGEYYGIHNIREAYDSDYITDHYNIKKDDIVIIKNPTGIAGVEVEEGYPGDEMHYNRMIEYLKVHDIKEDDAYDFVKTQIDIENFIEYNVLQIYCDNRDWPGNNLRIWRKRTPTYDPNSTYGHDGRWRWMVFDLDYGFGLFQGEKAVKNDSLKRVTEKSGPDWPNPPWSTFLLRTLLENDKFKYQFINTFADRLNDSYSPKVVLDKINTLKEIYTPNIEEHINKWNLHANDISSWIKEIEVIKNFAIKRPYYIRQYIMEYFDLRGLNKIKVNMTEGGFIKVNSLEIKQSNTPWAGIYFKDIPLTIEAVPQKGFMFTGWEGSNNSQDKKIKINLSQDSSIKGIFKKIESN